jgi:predicted flavoprotein YhiN
MLGTQQRAANRVLAALFLCLHYVTAVEIATEELSSQTMAVKSVSGLYFIGEVVDVTGQLGGYNFQWAWASGYAAGQSV